MWKPSEYTVEQAIKEAVRYNGIYLGDNYVTKDHDGYIELCVDADNAKGHVSYDIYFDDNGHIHSVPHK